MRHFLYWSMGLFLFMVGCAADTASTPMPTVMASPMPTATAQPIVTGDADVLFVHVVKTAADTYTFHVTVEHADTGWEDYADGWDVVLPDDTVLLKNETDSFTRLLLHPHETEQPFTRSQNGLVVSAEIPYVTVRAHDIVDGFGGQTVRVVFEDPEGDLYTIQRP